MMCKVLIADDETLARQALKIQLSRFGGAELVAECADGGEAIRQICLLQPDVLFLDIRTPTFSGLEVVQQLPENYAPVVIFVTAFDEYTLQAFESQAMDYLLKPFTPERFTQAFERALRQVALLKGSKDYNEQINQLKQQLIAPGAPAQSAPVLVRTGTRIVAVPIDQLDWLEADGDFVWLHTPDKKHLHRETLTHLLERIGAGRFVRIHRSVAVALDRVKAVRSRLNGDYDVVLDNGRTLRLSRHYRESLRGILL